ncbi:MULTISPECIES: fimbrial protein [unclassified Serratia (in: enterobacteria)]|uniref:fimbrial protein n=1 Tax=unclassified Serratia (in: enterobacteria) TaxID=2647522 RepID=UPI0005068E80|nr:MULTISPECIES: fimbrial protein [unclassified Serratia (in: enterobacteria)]KFK93154.1 ferrous iron transporter B [Serratia sp. Ag2]KFK99593.1 ferrous iron transporter B [Serratia sp. Ag1]
MKKNLLAIAVLASSSVFSLHAAATDGDVKFTGEITDVTCKVDTGSATPLAVTLGKVAKTSFPDAGARASATKFTLQLSACPDTITSAKVKFDGTAIPGTNGLLALTDEAGVATGIGIELSDDSNSVLPLFTASKAYTLQKDVVNNLDFVASYISTSKTITTGPANATASFTINYN